MGIAQANNLKNVIDDKTPKNSKVPGILLEEKLGSETPWTNENCIFEPRPNACHVGNCLALFGINNKATKNDLRRVLSTCGEIEDVTLITKSLPNGTKWAFAQFKKNTQGKRA